MYGNDGRLPHRFSAPQHTCRARYAITRPSVRLTVTRLDQSTRSSATAEKQRVSCPHGGGWLSPSAHCPYPPLATPMRMVESDRNPQQTYVKRTVR